MLTANNAGGKGYGLASASDTCGWGLFLKDQVGICYFNGYFVCSLGDGRLGDRGGFGGGGG